MRWIDELEQRAASEPSMFRAQLLREDVARLRRLVEIARSTADEETYLRAGRRLQWTTNDARTAELGEVLDAMLHAVREAATTIDDASAQARMRDTWVELTRIRMERLVGCLSTPVPRPGG